MSCEACGKEFKAPGDFFEFCDRRFCSLKCLRPVKAAIEAKTKPPPKPQRFQHLGFGGAC